MRLKGIENLAKELLNRDQKVVIFETFFYLLTISVAVVGNSCVLLAVYRNSRLRTIPNYFIVSLAISDILLPLLCAPYSIAVAIVGYWPFNDSVCQSQGFFRHNFSLRLFANLNPDRDQSILPNGPNETLSANFYKVENLNYDSIWSRLSLLGTITLFTFGSTLCLSSRKVVLLSDR